MLALKRGYHGGYSVVSGDYSSFCTALSSDELVTSLMQSFSSQSVALWSECPLVGEEECCSVLGFI